MILAIFAKLGTNERVLFPVPSRDKMPEAMCLLNDSLGGNWVWVQSLVAGTALLFNAEVEYRGFNGQPEYCPGQIKNVHRDKFISKNLKSEEE